MKMGIGLGVGINRSNYAQGIFGAYATRVVADGGVVESGSCVDAVSSLLQSASLLLIPSGYKGGKLYAEIPTNGNGDLTWTRGGDAFRTNASGVLQRVPWNLLSYSEDFSNAAWTKSNATIVSNDSIAPNGTLTADKFTATANNAQVGNYIIQQAITYTFSVYVKSATGGSVSGKIGGQSSSVTFTSFTATNEWTLVTCTALSLSGNRGSTIEITNSGDSLYIWGAQLVEGTTAQTYLPTTDRLNFPRLSYMYGSCPSALLEPQRTNLALQSQDFDNASWSKTNATVTANTTTSPDGNTNADTLVRGATTTLESMCRQNTTQSNSTAYTLTVYAKQNTSGALLYLRNFAIDASSNTGVVTFALDGTNTITAGTSYTGKATIQSVGNGWYRCSIQGTTLSTIVLNIIDIGCSTNAGLVTGSASASIFLYGAQLEAGAYPTTYIPTTSATATRVADSFSRNNIYTNGLISASGGTWFVSFVNNAEYIKDSGDRGLFLDTSNTGNTNGFQFVHRNTGGITQRILINKRVSGADTIIYQSSVATIKLAIKWNGTSADVFANGTKVVTATSFTTTAMEFLNFTSDGVPFFIQQMALYPEPLTDTKLIELTTL